MDYLFSKCRETRPEDGNIFHEDCLIIPEWAVDRWKKQAKTPYSDLTPSEMDSDRTEADKFLSVFADNQSEPISKELKPETEQLAKWMRKFNEKSVCLQYADARIRKLEGAVERVLHYFEVDAFMECTVAEVCEEILRNILEEKETEDTKDANE